MKKRLARLAAVFMLSCMAVNGVPTVNVYAGGVTGEATGEWRTENGVNYYYESGRMITGVRKIGNYWYYFDENGQMYTGWRKDGSKTYHYDGYGRLAQGIRKIDGYWYYFNGNGTMYTGWRKDGSKTYHYDSYGHLAQGMRYISGKKYYFNGNGTLAKEGVVKAGTKWYYIKADGTVHTGWRYEGNKTYYYDSEGRLTQGAAKIGSYWYYFNGNGTMYTGWRQDGDKTCYYGKDGRLVTGTATIDGEIYHFQSNGDIIRNTFVGSDYYGSNGEKVSPSEYGNIFYGIMGTTNTTVEQMARYYEKHSSIQYPSYALSAGGAPTVRDLAQIFYEEAEKEGVKAEVAWVQCMLETGYLKYGGQVKIEQFNFAGLGATDRGEAGATFSDVRTGVRAQIQHLKAYGSTLPLNNSCVDPRFHLVKRGSALYVEILGQKENPEGYGWATGKNYGVNLKKLLDKLMNS